MPSPGLLMAKELEEAHFASAALTQDGFDVAALRRAIGDIGLDMPPGVKIQPAATANCHWVTTPISKAGRRIVYSHGGGFVAGGLPSHRTLLAWLAYYANASVLFVDYTLAPEAQFPTQLHQVHDALTWAASHGPSGAADATDLFIAGDSAGAGIALAALLMARANGAPLPDGALFFCGMFNLAQASSAFIQAASRRQNMVEAYLGDLSLVQDPFASPLQADLTGLPPLFLQTGTQDGCRADSEILSERAEAAGVPVTLQVWQDTFHVWQRFAPLASEADEALQAAGRFIAEQIGS